MLMLSFDGLFREVPGSERSNSKAGFMSYGWLIFRDEKIIARGHGVVARGQDATSNVAEYLALIEGLEALSDLNSGSEPVHVSGDAKCIIEQMEGRSAVNSPTIKPLYRKACKLSSRFDHLTWSWMPRRHNHDADALTRRAMKQVRSDQDHYQAAIRALSAPNPDRRKSRAFLPLLDLRIYQPLKM